MRADTERLNPKISVNKLAEYMVAAPVRRRAIIREQKRPREFVTARYTDAVEVIATSILPGGKDEDALVEALERLMGSPASTTWELQKNVNCAEALESFLEAVELPDLSRFNVIRPRLSDPARIGVAGVDVSIRPEVLLAVDGEVVGAVKIYVSKTFPLGDDAASYVGVATQRYLVQRHPNVSHSNTFTIDVFAARVHTAPRAYRRKWHDIEAACEEIARAWHAA